MPITSSRDLDVWRKSMNMVTQCYQVTQTFPKSEIYGLTGQLRRAAVSVPANIAEGQARQHTKEFVQFVAIAQGSLAELETHLLIAGNLNYLEPEQIEVLLILTADVGKMLSRLRAALLAKEQSNA